jgi:4-alpha-glucanotransferase
MGLFRLYWIPSGSAASQGAYVRYPHEEILAVAASECARSGAFAIGEDLGTVEGWIRESMAAWGILGSKVLWFESDPPSAFPEASLASVTTHDLPTLAGQWSGKDEAEQKALGLPVDPKAMLPALDRVMAGAGIDARSGAEDVVRRVHRLLAESSSALVAATLDDALKAERRPNLPGTTVQRPNWRIPLPKTLEEIEADPLVLEIAKVLDRRSGNRPTFLPAPARPTGSG